MDEQGEQKARSALKGIERDIDVLERQIFAAEYTIERARAEIEQFTKVRNALLSEAQIILDQLDGRAKA